MPSHFVSENQGLTRFKDKLQVHTRENLIQFINPYSAGIDFSRQNVDPRTASVKIFKMVLDQ